MVSKGSLRLPLPSCDFEIGQRYGSEDLFQPLSPAERGSLKGALVAPAYGLPDAAGAQRRVVLFQGLPFPSRLCPGKQMAVSCRMFQAEQPRQVSRTPQAPAGPASLHPVADNGEYFLTQLYTWL